MNINKLIIILATCKALKPAVGTAWKYAKVEMIPPFTSAFFTGAGGRKLEEIVSNAANGMISSLQKTIRDMDAEKERLIRQKEEVIRIAQEKVKLKAKMAAEKARAQAQAAKAKAAKAPEPPKDKPKDVPPKSKPEKKPEPASNK